MLGKIHHLDCLDGLAQMEPESVDFVFADLPYGRTQNEWDDLIPTDRLWPALRRVCKVNGAMVFTAMQPFTSLLVCSNMDDFKFAMIWEKNKGRGFFNAKKQPMRTHEDLLVFYRKQPLYVPQMTDGHEPMHKATKRGGRSSTCYGEHGESTNNFGTTQRYPTTVLRIPVLNNDDPERIHPNQKPIALVDWFLKTYTQPGEVVLDPTAGSGTTAVASKLIGRRFVGFETDAAMVERANARLASMERVA